MELSDGARCHRARSPWLWSRPTFPSLLKYWGRGALSHSLRSRKRQHLLSSQGVRCVWVLWRVFFSFFFASNISSRPVKVSFSTALFRKDLWVGFAKMVSYLDVCQEYVWCSNCDPSSWGLRLHFGIARRLERWRICALISVACAACVRGLLCISFGTALRFFAVWRSSTGCGLVEFGPGWSGKPAPSLSFCWQKDVTKADDLKLPALSLHWSHFSLHIPFPCGFFLGFEP